jgi:hypothetical protein
MNRLALPSLVLSVLCGANIPHPALAADSGRIRINEVLSANAFTLADSNGDYSDWIEIRNDGPGAVTLAGFGLSDDPGSPFKWTFPQVTLEPGRCLVVFASGKDGGRPELHANFELDAHGETLVLSSPDGRVIDSVAFGPIPLDASYGRRGDGGEAWEFFEIPTPGEANGTPSFRRVLRGRGFRRAVRGFGRADPLHARRFRPGPVFCPLYRTRAYFLDGRSQG